MGVPRRCPGATHLPGPVYVDSGLSLSKSAAHASANEMSDSRDARARPSFVNTQVFNHAVPYTYERRLSGSENRLTAAPSLTIRTHAGKSKTGFPTPDVPRGPQRQQILACNARPFPLPRVRVPVTARRCADAAARSAPPPRHRTP